MGPEHLTRHSSSLADAPVEDGGDGQPMADVQGPPPQESETVPKEADSPHGNTAAVTTSTENPDHALVNSAHEAAQPAASKD